MRWITLLAFVAVSGIATAQTRSVFQNGTNEFMTDAFGQPVYTQQKYNWEGNIFYPENYSIATITAESGKIYRNIKAKLNLLEGTLMFTDSGQREFVTSLAFSKVEFEGLSSFIRIKEDTSKAFYQLLDWGKASLVKKWYVTYQDKTTYGSTSITRVFQQKQSYYVYQKAELTALNRTKNAVLTALSDKSGQVQTFMDKENISIRKDEDLAKLFHYYNSLH